MASLFYFVIGFSVVCLGIQGFLLWFLALKDCINSDRDTGTKVIIILLGYICFPFIATTLYLFVKLFERKKLVIEK